MYVLEKKSGKVPVLTVPLGKLGEGASSSDQTQTQLRLGN